jgi:hypothetical protein
MAVSTQRKESLQRQRLLQQTPWQLLKQLQQQLAPLATSMKPHHHLLPVMLQLAVLVLLLETAPSGWLLLTCLGLCLGHTLARAGARTSLHTCSGHAAWRWC